MHDQQTMEEKKKVLAAKANAYKRGLDGVEIKKVGDKPKKSSTSNVCKKINKGDLLFSGIHNRTFFTGTPGIDADNLTVLRRMDSGMVDLIYLDPPFNSNRNYAAPIDSAAGEVGAFFSDMFARDDRLKLMQDEILSVNPAVFSVIHAAGKSRGASSRSYLTFMATRLMEMHRVLKATGSIYLHCDPTMSHYLKMLMDAIFGVNNFQNEVIWRYDGPQSPSPTRFATKHDVILRYAKDNKKLSVAADNMYEFIEVSGDDLNKYKKDGGGYFYDLPSGDYTPESIARLEKEGRVRYTKNGKPRIKYYLEREGGRYLRRKKISSVWDDIASLGQAASSKENTGYPTQKPLALLHRIIEVSTQKGDIVLDPFCGCGTACVAAQELGRKWIGIDAACAAGVVLVERGDMMMNRADINWRMIDKKGNGLPKRADDGATAIDLRPVKPSKTPPLSDKKRKEALDTLYPEQKELCRGCGAHKLKNELEVDHKLARSHGGGNEMENLQLLCRQCNQAKGDKTMEALWTHLFSEGRGISHDGLLFIARKFGGNLGEDASG